MNILKIRLNGDDLPWVTEVKHLGNTLESSNTMRRDVSIKKGQFIGKMNSLLQEFHYVSPAVLFKIVNVYAVSFHGSGLWDLFSNDCDHLYKAWNVAVRLGYNVPYTTHRYLIEPLSECMHLKVMLTSRYVNFVKSLTSSPKYSVRVLASTIIPDLRTVMGRTMRRLSNECKCEVSVLSVAAVKKEVMYFPLPEEEKWRVGMLKELLDADVDVPGFLPAELQEMKEHLCTS